MEEIVYPGEISADDALRAGVALHRQGRLEQAEVFYRGVLKEYPDHPDALHFLGIMRNQLGHAREAAELIEQALGRVSDNAGMWLNFGNVLRELGRLEEAGRAYEEAIRLEPSMAAPSAPLHSVTFRAVKPRDS